MRTRFRILACALLVGIGQGAWGAPGDLDPTFGSSGIVTTTMGSIGGSATAIALQPDGKIVVVGDSRSGDNTDMAALRYQSDGSLDATFGSGGKVTTPVGLEEDHAGAVALQPDGKIVAVGYSFVGGWGNFAVVRYNPDGSLDSAFGSGGKVITPLGTASEAVATALQPDGKIVAVGTTSSIGGNAQFAVVRYDSDGSLDSTFGTEGKVTTSVGSSDVATAIALQPDGKIVVAGNSWTSGKQDFALVRYDADGSLDPTFGSGGKVTTPIGSFTDALSATLLQSDGKIIVVGRSLEVMSAVSRFAVARHNTDGSLDSGFGTGGKVITSLGDNAQPFGAALQADGKIVTAGYSFDGNGYWTAVRYLGDPVPVCGNGAIETGESCDDGDTTAADGCSSTCQIEPGSLAYVTSQPTNTVQVIHAIHDRVVGTIPVPSPFALALAPNGQTLYVGSGGAASVYEISTATHQVTGTISLTGTSIESLAVSADGARVYAGVGGPGRLVAIDSVTNGVVGSTAMQVPFELAAHPGGTALYATTGPSNSVIVVHPTTLAVLGTHPLPGYTAYGLALNAGGTRLYASYYSADAGGTSPGGVVAYDVTTPLSPAAAGSQITGLSNQGLALSADEARLIVASNDSRAVVFLNSTTLAPGTPFDTTSYGAGPADVAVEPSNAKAFATLVSANTVLVLSPTTGALLGSIAVPGPGRIVVRGCAGSACCGNQLVDPGEQCDAGADNGTPASCCDAICQHTTAGAPCATGACDGAGLCVPATTSTTTTTVPTTTTTTVPATSTTTTTVPATSTTTTTLAGTCGNGLVDAGEQCDDHGTSDGDCCSSTCQLEPTASPCTDDANLCTVDRCDGSGTCQHVDEPDPLCVVPAVPGKAGLSIKNLAGVVSGDAIKFKWSGPGVDPTDFGPAPSLGAPRFELCIYDQNDPVTTRVFRARALASVDCGGVPCWKQIGGGWKYKSKNTLPDGLTGMLLKGGAAGAKLQAKGKGALLALPALPLTKNPSVVAQLRASSGGCWGAVFSTHKKSDTLKFDAKSD